MLGEVYERSHIVCVPSRSDPLPTVALEAMIAGRAVVASRVGGLQFMVEDDRTGVLVEPDSPKALAAAIARLASSPANIAELGHAGHERARERFSWPLLTDRLAAEIGKRIRK
jgi:glycosyltransferase involved in cell wall biosynthesis